jgi:Putative Actinobacterial Holin-X, holin superfamily III
MLSEVVAYAASRATSGAVDSISRRAGWFAAGGVVLLFGFFFAVLAAFWMIEPQFGPVQSAVLVATTCLVFGLLCFIIPGVVQVVQRRRAKEKIATGPPVNETLEAVNTEAAEAVDYFGPLKVMATAFMLGVSAAKQLRRARTM